MDGNYSKWIKNSKTNVVVNFVSAFVQDKLNRSTRYVVIHLGQPYTRAHCTESSVTMFDFPSSSKSSVRWQSGCPSKVK